MDSKESWVIFLLETELKRLLSFKRAAHQAKESLSQKKPSQKPIQKENGGIRVRKHEKIEGVFLAISSNERTKGFSEDYFEKIETKEEAESQTIKFQVQKRLVVVILAKKSLRHADSFIREAFKTQKTIAEILQKGEIRIEKEIQEPQTEGKGETLKENTRQKWLESIAKFPLKVISLRELGKTQVFFLLKRTRGLFIQREKTRRRVTPEIKWKSLFCLLALLGFCLFFGVLLPLTLEPVEQQIEWLSNVPAGFKAIRIIQKTIGSILLNVSQIWYNPVSSLIE